jgi:competence protein ComEA
MGDDPSQSFLNRFKIPLGLALVGIVLILGGFFTSNFSFGSKSTEPQFPKESLVEVKKQITVDVSGSVNSPGVYHLDSDSRIEDAVKSAGGLKGDANSEYISKYLNMAQKLSDGTKIYIPKVGETGPAVAGGLVGAGSAVAGASTTSVNINSSTQSELEGLSGIGPVTAAKIISSRPYQKVDDLLSQKIVSKATFEKIKAQLVVY